jgi:hypothetical protein
VCVCVRVRVHVRARVARVCPWVHELICVLVCTGWGSRGWIIAWLDGHQTAERAEQIGTGRTFYIYATLGKLQSSPMHLIVDCAKKSL